MLQALTTIIAAHFSIQHLAAAMTAKAVLRDAGRIRWPEENTLENNCAFCWIREAGLLDEDSQSAFWRSREDNTLWWAFLKEDHLAVCETFAQALAVLATDEQNETLCYAQDRVERGLRIC